MSDQNGKKASIETQRDLSQKPLVPYSTEEYQGEKAPLPNDELRGNQISTKGDKNQTTYNVGLKDIDEAFLYYVNEHIKPTVRKNAQDFQVPIIYGNAERWASVQANGFYRDKNGKIQVPLIMFKRDSVEKNRNIGNKLDANNPNNIIVTNQQYSRRNSYDQFSALNNRAPSYDLRATVIPDYISVSYSCIIFTDYVEQMNQLIEAFNFASDSYWGRPDRFKFNARIDSYSVSTELSTGQDRAVKSSFTVNMNGYLLPESINRALVDTRKYYSKTQLRIKYESEGGIEDIITKI